MATNLREQKRVSVKRIDEQDQSATTRSTSSSESRPSNRGLIFGTTLIIVGLAILLCALLNLFANRFPYVVRGSLPRPILNELPQYTNQPNITISGSTDANLGVVLGVDGRTTDNETTSDGEGKFQFSYTMPTEGEYRFSAASTRRQIIRFRSQFSDEKTVIFDQSAPRDTITFDNLPKETERKEIDIRGSVPEPGRIKIKVGDKEYTTETDGQGNFRIRDVQLRSGRNNLEVEVQDRAGNTTKITNPPQIIYAAKASVNGNGASTSKGNGQIPEAAGELEKALSMLFGNAVLPVMAVLALLAFAASSGLIWLTKEYGTKK